VRWTTVGVEVEVEERLEAMLAIASKVRPRRADQAE
jgi:hypothetical protein